MQINLTMPEWWQDEFDRLPTNFPTAEDRMREVIRFSRMNVEQQSGGPFAAGVFERDSGKLITIGVNRVVPLGMSSAHAEIMALTLAQKKLGTFDLGGEGQPAHQLVVNWRTCAMCYGAAIWSGVRELVIAGSDESMEAITGFDEGPLPVNWDGELQKRGIRVIDNVLHDEAVRVFERFRDIGAMVYNGRLGE